MSFENIPDWLLVAWRCQSSLAITYLKVDIQETLMKKLEFFAQTNREAVRQDAQDKGTIPVLSVIPC